MKLTKEKKQQIMLVWIMALAAMAGIYMLLINAQKASSKTLETKIQEAEKKFKNAKRLVDGRETTDTELADAEKKLKNIESTMPSGDLSGWISKALDEIKIDHNIEIVQGSDQREEEVKVFPVFPYKAAVYLVEGRAYYHDFGLFLADFENRLPYTRVQNIELIPASNVGPDEKEKLRFTMEIVALIKPRN